jgi:translation initiation factor IF-2
MSDTEKPKLGMRAPLGIKRTVETGQVKQSFSHGRQNTVVVEVKRRRILGKPGEAEVAQTPAAPEPVVAAPPPPPPPPPPAPKRAEAPLSRQEMQAKLLREAEEARLSALEESRKREEQARLQASEDEKRRAEENRRAEEEAARAAEEAAKAPDPEPVQEEAAAPAPAAAPEDRQAPVWRQAPGCCACRAAQAGARAPEPQRSPRR